MDLSIIIRCCHDPKVFQCIESVDESVEIIVSMCENMIIESRLKNMGIKYCIVPKGNLSITSNRGLNIAQNSKVIITDSDTYFERGCIKKVYNVLNYYLAVSCKIKFLYSTTIIFSKIIAEARDYVNSLDVIFTPGIGLKKEILPLIGGYYFNEKVPFGVDAELDFRIKNVSIPYKILNSAIVYHRPEKIIPDLKAAFRIGKGCRIGTLLLSQNKQFSDKEIELKAVKKSMYKDIIRRKGIFVFLYQLIWDFFYHLGWRYERFKVLQR